MRILADECCPGWIVAALRADGRDVWCAAEAASGASDGGLLAAHPFLGTPIRMSFRESEKG